MKNSCHNNILIRCKVLPILTLYFFVTLFHIFFLSGQTIASVNAPKVLTRYKLENIQPQSNLQRTDKATFKVNKTTLAPRLLVLHLHWGLEPDYPVVSLKYCRVLNAVNLPNKQNSYLSFLSLRI